MGNPEKRNTVIQDCIKAHSNGSLILSNHAQEQMKKRNILYSDIEEMIYQAQREDQKDELTNDKSDWKYAIRGKNNNGDKDLRIIVIFDDPKAIIVTAIDKNL